MECKTGLVEQTVCHGMKNKLHKMYYKPFTTELIALIALHKYYFFYFLPWFMKCEKKFYWHTAFHT